jgi:hypothetical protein
MTSRPLPVILVFVWLLTLANLCLIVVFSAYLFGNPRPVTHEAAVKSPVLMSAPDKADLDALNGYGQAIARAGLTGCAMPMNDLSERLLAGKTVGVYRFPVSRENFVSLSMEVKVKSGAVLYITFGLSQGTDGSCQIAYEAVSDWANSCEEIVKTVFKDFIPTRNLLKSVVLLRHKDNQNRKIFTMPVQNGCIAIEKEIISTQG